MSKRRAEAVAMMNAESNKFRLRAERAEAAIQRVRELHHTTVDCVDSREGPRDVEHCAECGYIPLDGEMCPTIRALEGDNDD